MLIFRNAKYLCYDTFEIGGYNMKKKIQSYFSLLGKSFLLAVSVMSFFALLLSIGAVLKNPHLIKALPFLANQGIQFVANVLNESGLVVIRFMPLIFAVAIAIGLAPKGDKDISAFSAVVGYCFMISFSALTLKFFNLALEPNVTIDDQNIVVISQTLEMRKAMQGMILGVQTIDTGVLGGIAVGMTAAAVTKRFKNQKLPMIFGFYQGRHFPAIMTGIVCMVAGILVTFIWPIVGNAIYSLASIVVSGTGIIGSFIFGFVERLLIPTGLHHVWYSIVHFTPVGGVLEIGGETFAGTRAITTGALSNPEFNENISHVTRLWLGQGATPIKVFGIPGACLAYYTVAKDKNKAKAVALTAMTASVFAGVTEPFEFLFMFLSPVLFLIHCVLTGISFALLELMRASYLGGNNIIELVVNGVFQGHKSTWIPVVIVGLAMFLAYFMLFRWFIPKYNIPLPGCEQDDEEIEETLSEKVQPVKADKEAVARQILIAIGGEQNLKEYTNCISRLRLFVKNPEDVNKELLHKIPESLGVVVASDEEYHIVFGMNVDAFREALDNVIKS